MLKKIVGIIAWFSIWMFCFNMSAQEAQAGSVIICVEQPMTRSVPSPLLEKAEVIMELHTDTNEISVRSSGARAGKTRLHGSGWPEHCVPRRIRHA